MDRTHDPATASWLPDANGHADFPLQNLPFCVFSRDSADRRAATGGVRVGDHVVDLGVLADSGALDSDALTAARAAQASTLNDLFALPAQARRALRVALHALLADGSPHTARVHRALTPVEQCETHLPFRVGDFTDFYAGIHHAENVGRLFRPDEPLLPNYAWLPIGYHGRASTVCRSGTAVHRPRGQLKAPGDAPPEFAPCRRLDIEVELGVWVAGSPRPGHAVPITGAPEQIGGFCVLNDWSARDVQTWEYRPLGPFLAKNFATTVSDYVVTPEALEPYRIALDRPAGAPDPLPYLHDDADARRGAYEIDFEVALTTAAMRADGVAEQIVSRTSSRHLFWTVAQLVTHHSSGGCELQAGDLLGSGTISGPAAGEEGSLLEATSVHALTLPGGESRTFLEDGDEVVIRARAQRAGVAPVGFGECRGRVLPPLG